MHVTFTPSGAGSLRQALARLGRSEWGERVVCLDDDLAIGPLSSPEARARWMEDELGETPAPEVDAARAAAWAEATSPGCTVVAWWSRRSAQEHAGFLELLCRRGGSPLRSVEVSDVEPWFAYLSAERIVAMDLVGRAVPVAPDEAAAWRATWQRLRAEDAPLWQSGARVIGGALEASQDAAGHANYQFLWSRVQELVDAGVLEAKGDFESFQTTWVRRARPR